MWFEMKQKAIRVALFSAVVIGMSLVGSDKVAAQNIILSQLYGKGVHAFFDGDFQSAHGFLSEAIDSQSRDPRAYFFRAMAYHHLGRPDEAAVDMEMGARLEIADRDQFYPVSRSLERVQGQGRILIETFRRDARLEQFQRARDRQQKRFGDGNNAPPAAGAAPRELPAGEAVPVDEGGDEFKADGDPFGDDPADGEADAVDPFADDAGEDTAEEDSGDDPFADDAGDEEEASDGGDDPFADDEEVSDEEAADDVFEEDEDGGFEESDEESEDELFE